MSDRQSVPLKLMHLESRESKKTWRKTPQHAASSQSQTPRRILLACWDVSLGGMSQIPPRPPLAPWLGSLSCDLSEWRSRWAVCISHRHASGGLRSVAAATEQVIDPQSLPGCGGGGCHACGRHATVTLGRRFRNSPKIFPGRQVFAFQRFAGPELTAGYAYRFAMYRGAAYFCTNFPSGLLTAEWWTIASSAINSRLRQRNTLTKARQRRSQALANRARRWQIRQEIGCCSRHPIRATTTGPKRR